MSEVDYKKKYKELKAAFLQTTDRSFRLGYQQGMKDCRLEMLQQQQQQQEQAQMGMQVPEEGQAPPTEQAEMAAQMQGTDELGEKIAELSELISKAEGLAKSEEGSKASQLLVELTASLDTLRQAQSSLATKLVKSSEKQLERAYHGLKNTSQSFKSNMDSDKKAAVSMQKKMVDSLIAKFDEEKSRAVDDIFSSISGSGKAE